MLRKYFVHLVCLTVVLHIKLSLGQNITITIPNGKIKGKTETTKTNFKFYSFSGVRYAEPPVGNLRFKSPVPVKPWNDTYDATYEKNICYQTAVDSTWANEDCLFLNIYTPKISNDSLPVMFYIHGGGFIVGTSGRNGGFGPDFFMEYEVVLVSINYRLGAFGFLSTNDLVIPGNAGLKDQTLALKWVQNNIKYFGGDPSKVMIFGESAGSASVSYHLLSRQSAGLFRAAIQESGSALSAWAYQRDQRYYTFKTASFIDPNFVSNSSEDLLDFLLKASASDIRAASQQIVDLETPANRQIQNGFYYSPVLEPDHDDAFITKSMYESFVSGDFNKVTTIIGMNAEEGMMEYNANFQDTVNAFNNNEVLLVPDNMHISANNSNKDAVIKAIEDFYGISKNITYQDQIAGTIKYLTDQCFARSIIKQAILQANYSDVYFYNFAYKGEMGNDNNYVAGTGNVTHGEELYYIFVRGMADGRQTDELVTFPESDRQTHYRMVKLWINFAITLNPTPEKFALLQNITWPKVDLSNGLKYLNINQDLSVETNPRNDAYKLWIDLYENYAIKPLDGF